MARKRNWNGGIHSITVLAMVSPMHAAVRLAEMDLQQTQSNLTETSATWNYTDASIPSSGTVSSSIDISTDIEIEHVLVYMDISHAKAGDLSSLWSARTARKAYWLTASKMVTSQRCLAFIAASFSTSVPLRIWAR